MEDDALVGKTLLGLYRVEGKLAEGGMGAVFMGENTNLATKVVIKTMHARFLTDPDFRERFSREVQQLIGLQHPSIVRIQAQGVVDGTPFLILDYMAGGDLAAQLSNQKGGAQSPEQVLQWASAMADALDYMHQRGFIHRDMKPGNVLFDLHGRAHLADFGIAKTTDEATMQPELTGTGAVIGSPKYMAPEQALGREVSPATDQYALAATMYVALCGRLPIEARTAMRLLLDKARKDPTPVRSYAPQVSPSIEMALARALSRVPGNRFDSCGELIMTFRAALENPVPESPPQAAAPVPPPEAATHSLNATARTDTAHIPASTETPARAMRARPRSPPTQAKRAPKRPQHERKNSTVTWAMGIAITAALVVVVMKSGGSSRTPDSAPKGNHGNRHVSWHAPNRNGMEVRSSRFVVSARVEGVGASLIRVNGDRVGRTASDGTFRHPITLRPHKDTPIRIGVADGHGGVEILARRTVRFVPAKSLKRTEAVPPPSGLDYIVITHPSSATTTVYSSTFRVRGRLDGSRATSIWIGGERTPLDARGFTRLIKIPPSERHLVTFESRDQAGNVVKSETRTFRRSTPWALEYSRAIQAFQQKDNEGSMQALEEGMRKGMKSTDLPRDVAEGLAVYNARPEITIKEPKPNSLVEADSLVRVRVHISHSRPTDVVSVNDVKPSRSGTYFDVKIKAPKSGKLRIHVEIWNDGCLPETLRSRLDLLAESLGSQPFEEARLAELRAEQERLRDDLRKARDTTRATLLKELLTPALLALSAPPASMTAGSGPLTRPEVQQAEASWLQATSRLAQAAPPSLRPQQQALASILSLRERLQAAAKDPAASTTSLTLSAAQRIELLTAIVGARTSAGASPTAESLVSKLAAKARLDLQRTGPSTWRLSAVMPGLARLFLEGRVVDREGAVFARVDRIGGHAVDGATVHADGVALAVVKALRLAQSASEIVPDSRPNAIALTWTATDEEKPARDANIGFVVAVKGAVGGAGWILVHDGAHPVNNGSATFETSVENLQGLGTATCRYTNGLWVSPPSRHDLRIDADEPKIVLLDPPSLTSAKPGDTFMAIVFDRTLESCRVRIGNQGPPEATEIKNGIALVRGVVRAGAAEITIEASDGAGNKRIESWPVGTGR